MTINGLISVLQQLDGTKHVSTVIGDDVKVFVDSNGDAVIE